jgi:hypothetical protein
VHSDGVGSEEAHFIMRAAFYVTCAAFLSCSIAMGAGCSTPSIDGPPILGGSKAKTKKGKATNESPEGETTGGEEDETGRENPTTPPATTATTSPADAGPPPATGACASNTTQTACFRCCEDQNPQGIQFLSQAFGDCACSNGAGNCAAECGTTFCAGAAPSALCEQCLDASNTCRLQADTACEQNTACAAMFKCDDTSQCAAKP